MKKTEILTPWKTLPRPKELAPRPGPHRPPGSPYDQDGIRIPGSRAFLDAVLSRLTDLLAFENGRTRLNVSYQPATNKQNGAPLGPWACYVQVRRRDARGRGRRVRRPPGPPPRRVSRAGSTH